MKRCVFVIAIACILFLSAQWSQAATFYVDSCAGANGNGSQNSPFKTLTSAVTAADAVPGSDDIKIKGGTYPENPPINTAVTINSHNGHALIGTDKYNVGWQDHSFSLSGCSLTTSARLYYPARAPGQGTEVDCRGPYPLVVFAHAKRNADRELCSWSNPGEVSNDYLQVEGILKHLAESGFIVISVNWWKGYSGCYTDSADPKYNWWLNRAGVIIDAINYLRNLSFWAGKIDFQRAGLLGHSQGGAGSIYAAHQLKNDPNVNILGLGLIASVCPSSSRDKPCFLVPDSNPTDDYTMDVPMLVLHGTRDWLSGLPLKIYCQAGGPKHLIVVDGANHFGYTDGICIERNISQGAEVYPSEVGGVTGTSAQKLQQLTAAHYVNTFFSYYLHDHLPDYSDISGYLIQQQGQQCGHIFNDGLCKSDLAFWDEDKKIDDGDPGTSSTGHWYPHPGGYGGSLSTNGAGSTYTYEWQFSGEVKDLDIDQTWHASTNRCADTQIEISDSTGLLNTLLVNQQTGGYINEDDPNNHYLGTYRFQDYARLTIISQDGCAVSADFVQFSKYIETPPEWRCEPGQTFSNLDASNVQVNVCSCIQ